MQFSNFDLFSMKNYFYVYFIFYILTQSPCNMQSLSRYRFSNFILFFHLVQGSLYLKYISIWFTPFRPLYGGPADPQVPKMTNSDTIFWNDVRWKCQGILYLLTPKTQNFVVILRNWENWENFANFHSTYI